MLYLIYLVESWHCRLRFDLKNAATSRELHRVLGDARSCRSPRLVWTAAGYHYNRKKKDYAIKNRGGDASKRGCYFYYERVNTYKRSSFFNYKSFCSRCQRDDADVCRDGDAQDTDSFNDDDRGSVKTKESLLSSDEDLRAELLGNLGAHELTPPCVKIEGKDGITDRSESIAGLDDFPATRVIISVGFEFESCSVLREYEVQRRNFYELCSHLDDFMEFGERLELPGCDVRGSYFVVRAKHHHHHHHHRHLSFRRHHFSWLRIPPISSFAFWLFTFLFLSWPYRLAVELNTACVVLKIRKVFTADGCSCCFHGCKPTLTKAATLTPTTAARTTSSMFNKTCLGSVDVARKSRPCGSMRFQPPCDRERDTELSYNPSANTATIGVMSFNGHPHTGKHHRKTVNSFVNGFYRRPPSFTKSGSTFATPFLCSPRLLVRYREDEVSFSSEISSQKSYKTVLETGDSLRRVRPLSKSKLHFFRDIFRS